jgi:hypothetical protein
MCGKLHLDGGVAREHSCAKRQHRVVDGRTRLREAMVRDRDGAGASKQEGHGGYDQ